MTLERKIPLVTIKSISMSNMRDDWMALNVAASEDGDPVFSCYFKTELTANLLTLTQASIALHIAPTYDISTPFGLMQPMLISAVGSSMRRRRKRRRSLNLKG